MLLQAVNQINGICDSILQRSKEQASSSSLNDFLQVFLANKKCELRDINIHLKSTIPSGYVANFDEPKIQSILSNLVNNAAEASPEREKLHIEISAELLEQQVIFEVADNGSGIDKAFHDNVFQKNFTTKEKGNGIGLYECRKYLDSIGATISFQTSPTGTRFKVVLPNSLEKIFTSPQGEASFSRFLLV